MPTRNYTIHYLPQMLGSEQRFTQRFTILALLFYVANRSDLPKPLVHGNDFIEKGIARNRFTCYTAPTLQCLKKIRSSTKLDLTLICLWGVTISASISTQSHPLAREIQNVSYFRHTFFSVSFVIIL